MSSSVKKLNFEDKSSWYNTILEHPVFNSSTNGGETFNMYEQPEMNLFWNR